MTMDPLHISFFLGGEVYTNNADLNFESFCEALKLLNF